MGTERTSEKLRRFIHPLVMKALSATRSFRLEVSGTIPEGQPFLFVANHYCIDDIPTVGAVIDRHVYALVSDEDRGTLSGLALDVNGVVWTNRLNKEARRQSKEELVRHLRLGHSVLMYPEATWNLSPNLPMLPMNYGCITISLETGVPILPIYLHFAEGVCRVEINQPFYPGEDKAAAIRDLRDIMASSAWRFWEQEPFPGGAGHESVGKQYLGQVSEIRPGQKRPGRRPPLRNQPDFPPQRSGRAGRGIRASECIDSQPEECVSTAGKIKERL